VVFDIVYLILGDPTFAVVSFWMFTAGLIGGILAAPFGWYDWAHITKATRARTIGLIHGLVNTLVLLAFFVSWWMRYSFPARPEITASVFSFIGAALALVGGWLGGELVERLGVGVYDGANLDAPSSLSSASTQQPVQINIHKA
jgi:uncharacterized membrane protein